MTDEGNDRDGQPRQNSGEPPTDEELERAERAAMEETSGYIRHPYEREVIFQGHVTPLGDYMLEDLFSRYHPHLKEDLRIAQAVILWRDWKGRPLYLAKWWAPAALLTPEQLARAVYYDADLDFNVRERGVKGAAAKSREQFSMWEIEDVHDRRLLEVPDDYLAIHATREFYDEEGVCLCLERQIITDHWGFGHVRDLRHYKGYSTEW